MQCKWGRMTADGQAVAVTVGGNSLSASGYRRSTYGADEVDLLGIYCGDLDRSFLIPIDVAAGKHAVHLRLSPPRNCQRACINLAANFEFEGAIAQLGERHTGSVEVAGSSPASSTEADCGPTFVGCNPFRDRFGQWLERVASGEEVIVTRRGKPYIRLSPA